MSEGHGDRRTDLRDLLDDEESDPQWTTSMGTDDGPVPGSRLPRADTSDGVWYASVVEAPSTGTLHRVVLGAVWGFLCFSLSFTNFPSLLDPGSSPLLMTFGPGAGLAAPGAEVGSNLSRSSATRPLGYGMGAAGAGCGGVDVPRRLQGFPVRFLHITTVSWVVLPRVPGQVGGQPALWADSILLGRPAVAPAAGGRAVPRPGAPPLPSMCRPLGIPLPMPGTRAGGREPWLDRSGHGGRVAGIRARQGYLHPLWGRRNDAVEQVGGRRGSPRHVGVGGAGGVALPWSRCILLVLHVVLPGEVGGEPCGVGELGNQLVRRRSSRQPMPSTMLVRASKSSLGM